jgi:hypothetical protein
MRIGNYGDNPNIHKNTLRIGIFLAPFLLFLPLFTGKVLFWGTAGLQFIPWRFEAYQMLDQGVMPLWNALNGMGAPLMANYQSALFYPPAYILYGFYQLAGAAGLSFGFTLLVPLHLGWGAYGIAKLLEHLGFNQRAEILGGLAFGLGGYLVARSSFFSMIWAGVWLPWLILAVERMIGLRGRYTRLGRMLPAGLVLAMQLLAGHAQLAFYSVLLATFWLVLRVTTAGPAIKKWQPLVDWIMAGVSAAALALVQLLPTAEYLLQSQRSSAYEYQAAMTYSFWPWHFLTFILPDLFGNPGWGDYWGYGAYWEDAVYGGLMLVVFALIALMGLLQKRKSNTIPSPINRVSLIVMFFAMLIAAVLGLGQNTPIFPWLYAHVPTFSMFQAPARWMYLVSFLLIIVSAAGIRIWRRPTGRTRKWMRFGIAAGVGIIVAALASHFLLALPHASFSRAFLLFGATLSLGLLLLLNFPGDQNGQGSRRWDWMFFAFICADLLIAHGGLNPMIASEKFNDLTADWKGPESAFFTDSAEYEVKFHQFLRFDSYHTDLSWSEFLTSNLPNLNLLQNQYSYNNFDPLVPNHYAAWSQAVNSVSPTEMSVYLAKIGADFEYFVDADGTVQKSQLNSQPSVFGKSDFVRYRWSSCSKYIMAQSDLVRMGIDEITQESKPCIITPNSDQAGEYAYPDELSVREAENRSDRVSFQISSSQTGWFELLTTWYPGWQVTVDGVKQDLLFADGVFQAVKLTPGEHIVTFAYRPVSFYGGAMVSAAAWLLLMLSLIVSDLKLKR